MSGALSPHEEDARKAKSLYLDNLNPTEALADWHFAVREARRMVSAALRESNFLSHVTASIQVNAGHTRAFRHMMAPPMSQDQFKLVCPQWSKAAENRNRAGVSIESAEAIGDAIQARIDPGIVRWRRTGSAPSRADVRTVLKVIPALMAQQLVATARRKRLAIEQESAVVNLLEGEGWTRLPSKLIDQRAAVQTKHFMHKTRFATGIASHQEVDVACGLKGTYVVAMECKVTNDETNSVKRINDVLKKASAWKNHWGNFVLTAALLQGVVAPKDVQRLSDAGVQVFWSHNLSAFNDWLSSRI